MILIAKGISWPRPPLTRRGAFQLVGWVERSETHCPAARIVMGFGYRLYLSYAGYSPST